MAHEGRPAATREEYTSKKPGAVAGNEQAPGKQQFGSTESSQNQYGDVEFKPVT